MSGEFSSNDFKMLREDISELRHAMTKVADALQQLAVLEEKHSNSAKSIERAFNEIAKLESKSDSIALRVSNLEQRQPITEKTNDIVTNVIWICCSLLGSIILAKLGLLN